MKTPKQIFKNHTSTSKIDEALQICKTIASENGTKAFSSFYTRNKDEIIFLEGCYASNRYTEGVYALLYFCDRLNSVYTFIEDSVIGIKLRYNYTWDDFINEIKEIV